MKDRSHPVSVHHATSACVLLLAASLFATGVQSEDQASLDPEAQVEIEVAYTKQNGERLLAQLEFGQPSAKREAANLLRKCSPEILPSVELLLRSPDGQTAALALETYRHLRWKPEASLRMEIGDVMDDFESKAGPYPENWSPPRWSSSEHRHHDHLEAPDALPRPRCWLVHDLIDKSHERCLPYLLRMVDDPQCLDVAECAWTGILKYGGRAEVTYLLRHIDCPMSWNRDHAFYAIARLDVGLGFERAIKGLRENAGDTTCLGVLAELTSLKTSAHTEMETWQRDLVGILDALLSGGDEGVQMRRAEIVRNLTLRGAVVADRLADLTAAYSAASSVVVRKSLALALAKLQSPVVLDYMLDVRVVLNEQVRFGYQEHAAFESVVLDYLRASDDPRAAEAVERYAR